METKSKSISLKAILIAIGIGIWAIVFQNAGIIPTKQNVYVKGGSIDVSGSIDVDRVRGTVSVDGDVDVDIKKINGKRNVFYQDRDGEFMVLPVTVR
ncbi:MAG: hypothetical protein JST62_05320 [Bacteroidetes bacterium]|nr:hypothetical protein [Bacteroidota bacterium]